MRRIYLSAVFVLASLLGLAQTDGMSYQAVIINNQAQEIPGVNVSGNYLSEGEIAMRFTIYDQFEQVEYQERHEATTDKYGMVNLIIGQGERTGESPGPFNVIDWDGSSKTLLVELGIEGGELEEFSRQELLFVPYVYHRDVFADGSLTVEGETVLNDAFTVANESPSTLTGELNVQGTATFDGDTYFNTITVADWSELQGTLNVGDSATFNNTLSVLNQSPSSLSGSLEVDGETVLNNTLHVQAVSTFADSALVHGPLHVNEQQPTLLSGTLDVEGNTTLEQDLQVAGNTVVEGNTSLLGELTANATTDLNGQVTITANVGGSENSFNSYPLRVQGSNRGMAIKVNSNNPNGSNNFITFFDGQNSAVGRIEGQTSGEVASSSTYIYETAYLTAGIAVATANVLGATTSSTVCAGLGACVTAPIPSLNVASGTNLALAIANLAAYQAFAFSNLGVTYESGSADYAEWLKRANAAEQLSYGDIVSVRAGEISKDTEFGDQMMVISFKPAVLGNMPPEGETHLYEKVAFLGQVPVKVKGKVSIGDYILPSGGSDGFGVAVAPADMKIADYPRIVGTAWSASDDALSSYVNVAIGMNRNDLVQVVQNQQDEIEALRSEVDEMHRVLAELVPGYAERRQNAQPGGGATAPAVQEEKYENEMPTAEEMHLPLERSMFEMGLEMVKAQMLDQGIDVHSHPVYKDIFNDQAALDAIIDQAMDIANAQRERAIAIDRAHGYR